MKKLELENSQKFPETLEEQRDYYLKLYEKWAKWQQQTPEKLPEGYRKKEEFDFEKVISKIKKEDYWFESYIWDAYIEFVQKDEKIDYACLFLSLTSNMEIIDIIEVKIIKPIFIFRDDEYTFERWVCFDECYGEKLHLINKNEYEKDIELIFCDFDNVVFENFNRAYFTPRTNEYINKKEITGEVILINCEWSGLPVLRENLEMEEIGKKIWEKKIILDEKNKPLKTLLHKHLAFFSDFVELTEGKKVQIRITSETQIILVEIFSFNGATAELIERKYYEFIDYSLSDDKDTSKINFSEKIDIITRFKNEGAIGFAKGMFFGEKQRIEEVQKEKFEWQELAKDLKDLNLVLAKKIPNYKQNNSKISITNSVQQSNNMSNYNLNNSANNNSGNINIGENNQIIDNKISEILKNNSDSELRKILFEIKELKNQILQNPQIDQTDKEDSLEAVNEIVQNIEEKENPKNQKIIRNAFKKLSPIVGNFGLGIITNLAWEMLKSYFGIKF